MAAVRGKTPHGEGALYYGGTKNFGEYAQEVTLVGSDGGVGRSTILGKVLPREDASQADAVTGSITNSAQTVQIALAGYNGVVFASYGTFTGVTAYFEASYDGGTTWISLGAVSLSGSNMALAFGPSSAASAYKAYCPGATHARLRSTAWSSGTMTVKLIPQVFAGEVGPALTNSSVPALLSAGTNLAGDFGAQVRATAGGFTSIKRLLAAAATTNGDFAKASAGRLYKIQGYNARASVVYLKLFNKASAPTVGSDTPVVTLALKPSDAFNLDFGLIGQYFSTGIAFALTTGSADADTGALTASDIVGMNIWYA